eukprot:4970266-Pleurochrysis_carterae.AAC.1
MSCGAVAALTSRKLAQNERQKIVPRRLSSRAFVYPSAQPPRAGDDAVQARACTINTDVSHYYAALNRSRSPSLDTLCEMRMRTRWLALGTCLGNTRAHMFSLHARLGFVHMSRLHARLGFVHMSRLHA